MNRNIVLCVVLLSALVTQVYADWETKWEHNGVAMCEPDSDQAKVEIISDGSGGAITTWWSRSTVTPYWDIYAQRVDSSGNCLWDSNGVLICDQTYEDAIVYSLIFDKLWICSDGTGGAIISWVDCRSTGPGNSWETGDIYAQRVDSSGNCQWTANGVAICDQDSAQCTPQLISDGAGGAIIVWHDYRNGYYWQGTHLYGGDIYAQRVDSLGNIVWNSYPDGVPICDTIESQIMPNLVSDGCGGAIIAWDDNRTIPGVYEWDPYAQRVDSSGNVLWIRNGIVINQAPNTQSHPQLVSDGCGGAVIAWNDYRTWPAPNIDIYAQRVDSSGNLQWDSNGVAICALDDIYQYIPEICSDGSGGAIIAWSDHRWGNNDIYAQRVDSSGSCQWTANGIPVCVETYIQACHHLAPDDNGGAIITWHDVRNGSISYDIYANRVSSSGVCEWTNGIVICDALAQQYDPKICTDGSGGAIITWYDGRKSYGPGHPHSGDIYAQRLGIAGPGVDETRTNRLSKPITLLPCFPNPFSNKVKISYSISKKMKVELKVYDVAGHLVKTLVDGVEEPGSKIIEWHSRNDDGSTIPNGIYFLTLEAEGISRTRKIVKLR
jgi:hypothetical protein